MSFSQIRGQERAVRILQNEVSTGSVSGAYLFVGPDGVGKYLMALNFAKVLNCKKSDVDSCDECISCQKIDHLSHPDLRVMETEKGSIGIEEIRVLKREVGYSLYEGTKGVWIIKDADKLTQEAANSLLKILEEPPPRVVIILISQAREKLLPTILSRCETIPFSLLSSSEIRRALDRYRPPISGKIPLIEKLARGRIGEALLLAQDEAILNLREEILNDLAKNTDPDRSSRLVQSWKSFPPPQLERSLDMLLFWFRDLLILKKGGGEVVINGDRIKDLERQLDRYSSSGLIKTIDTIERTKRHLKYRVSTGLALQDMWLSLAECELHPT